MPEGAEEGILRGMYRLRTRRQGQAARAAARLGHDPARGACRRRAARRRDSAFRPTSGVSPASASCVATRSTSSAGTCCIRTRAARELRRAALRGQTGTVHRGDRLHEDRVRPDPPVGAGPATSCSAPTASAAATAATRCARISRSTAIDRGRGAQRARGRRRRRPQTVGDAIAQLGIDPEKRNPVTL